MGLKPLTETMCWGRATLGRFVRTPMQVESYFIRGSFEACGGIAGLMALHRW